MSQDNFRGMQRVWLVIAAGSRVRNERAVITPGDHPLLSRLRPAWSGAR